MAAAEASFFTQQGEQGSAKDDGIDLGDLKPGGGGLRRSAPHPIASLGALGERRECGADSAARTLGNHPNSQRPAGMTLSEEEDDEAEHYA